jgi:hypothetical protein
MTINYTIQAKPTVYRGQTFRSRLEARWAAFFDLLEWEWVYEPFHFGGWVPDFAIRAPGAQSLRKVVLVEVKPIVLLDDETAIKMKRCCPRTDGVLDYELLMLGLEPNMDRLGWLYEYCWEKAVFGRWAGQRRIGFRHEAQIWVDRISVQYDGGKPVGAPIPDGAIRRVWYEAECYADPDVVAEPGDIDDIVFPYERADWDQDHRPYLIDRLGQVGPLPQWNAPSAQS